MALFGRITNVPGSSLHLDLWQLYGNLSSNWFRGDHDYSHYSAYDPPMINII